MSETSITIEKPQFRAVWKSLKDLKALVQVVNTNSVEYLNIAAKPEGIFVNSISPDRVSAVIAKFPSSYFSEYLCTSQSETPFIVGIKIKEVSAILKRFKGDEEPLQMYFNENSQIVFSDGKKKFANRLEGSNDYDEKSFNFSTAVTIDAPYEEILEILQDASVGDDNVGKFTITVNEQGKVLFKRVSDLVDYENEPSLITEKDWKIEGSGSGMFNPFLLKNLVSGAPKTKRIKLAFSDNTPIIVTFGEGYITALLAPKRQD